MSDIVFDGMIFDRLREIGDQSDRIASLESEIERLRLTDAEREAIEWFAEVRKPLSSFDDGEYVFTLRKLFERLGGEQ